MNPRQSSRTAPDRLRVVTWNLFHGRDDLPEEELHGWRSRLLGKTVRGRRYAQVNHGLRDDFAAVLAREQWDVALLQEVSPRWLRPLCRAAGASGTSALTSRNLGSFLKGRVAAWNPDLLASSAGGSNQILVRPPWRLSEVRRLTLTRKPQRRRMLWARIEHPSGPALTVACIHLSSHKADAAAAELALAASAAMQWSAGLPLLLGGDLNLRTGTAAAAFDRLASEHGLTGPTPHPVIDHLLWNGPPDGPPVVLADERRELRLEDGLLVRLSDHPLVARELLLEGR